MSEPELMKGSKPIRDAKMVAAISLENGPELSKQMLSPSSGTPTTIKSLGSKAVASYIRRTLTN